MKAAKKPVRKTSGSTTSDAGLLFEIGTEELPYQFVPAALTAFAESAKGLLKDSRLAHGRVRTFGTPRRLVLIVESLVSRQESLIAETMGPSKAVAFDAAGQPTKAALGFAASHQVAVTDLEVRPTPKGDYVFAVKRDPGRAAPIVLADLLPTLVASLSFPKSMRWNATGMRFARPIRWLLALHGSRVITMQIAGVTSGDLTWGHRVLGQSKLATPRGLRVRNLASYVTALDRHGVVPDQDTRREMIRSQLADLAKSAGGTLHHDEELLEQAVYTVEYPQAVLGSFDATYLSLPKAVLMTAMKEHQGFFSLMNRNGALLPAFISVTNMKLADMRLIREGNERVLAARLADAQFFFDEDRKISLADRAKKLVQVTFHHKLGTLYQKQERIAKLIGVLASMNSVQTNMKATGERAARLSKADLLTGMVGEFPSLQGVMGGEYARHDGEPEEISRAISEHYAPQSMDGRLPDTLAGRLLSLADRLDTIAAFFHVGIVPTGSEDPFGLRRHASAVVRIIIEGNLRLDVGQAVETAKRIVSDEGFNAADQTTDTRHIIMNFMFERLRYYGRTVHALRHDVMEAVLSRVGEGPCDLFDLLARMKALQAITVEPAFEPLIVGFKRAHRLVEKEAWSQEVIDPARFQHPSESDLHKVLTEANERIPAAIADNKYAAALKTLVEMKSAIDGFFTGVLVNAEDESLRANRLSLLYAVDRLFLSVADFSQIVVQGA